MKGIEIKITAKFRASRRLRFEDIKRIMRPEIRPKRFETFEKQAPELDSRIVVRVVFVKARQRGFFPGNLVFFFLTQRKLYLIQII